MKMIKNFLRDYNILSNIACIDMNSAEIDDECFKGLTMVNPTISENMDRWKMTVLGNIYVFIEFIKEKNWEWQPITNMLKIFLNYQDHGDAKIVKKMEEEMDEINQFIEKKEKEPYTR
jgi:hypothetical protein